MCGIAGTVERVGRGADWLEDTAHRMIAPLVHRGPDGAGVRVEAEAGLALGHRRLSVIDLSPAGAQPMVSACGRFVITYNGEIYNAAELRADLEARGIRFRGHSDTEVLLEACAAWGVEQAVGRLIGMFAFAVWDRADRSLHLVRDRIGIKPLYYAASRERFFFASELRGLQAHPQFDPALDPEAIDAFLALDYVPAPLSIFRSVRKLEPGTILRVRAAAPERIELIPYWTLADAARKGCADRFAGTFGEAADELERLLRDAVRRRMVADVPLGAFLSGGIDSSTVVALMQQESARPVQTFTIGFSSGAFDEAPWAKAVALHLETDHREHYVGAEEIGKHGPAILTHHDEPFAEPSVLQTWILCRLVRRDVTVVLTGDGGDELFGGYARHVSAGRLFAHPALNGHPVARAAVAAAVPMLPRFLSRIAGRLPGLNGGLSPPPSAAELRALARGLRNPGLVHRSLAQGDTDRPGGPRIVRERIDAWLAQAAGLSGSERQQYIDAAGYLPDYILARFDRMSMAVSLELRVPILDHRIVEFAFRLPPAMKVRDMETKRVLRAVLNRHVPKALFERPKRGFGAPMAQWLKGPLREWSHDLMRSDTLRRHDLADTAAAHRAFRRLRTGRFRRPDFRWLALAAWCEANL